MISSTRTPSLLGSWGTKPSRKPSQIPSGEVQEASGQDQQKVWMFAGKIMDLIIANSVLFVLI